MKENYKNSKHDIGLRHKLPDREIDVIDAIQFELVRKAMKEKKNIRLPNFGIFLLRKMFRDG